MSGRTILVTSALPYANGPIHIGHLVEYIQTDVWARFQRLQGNRCLYLCADDTHGTSVMLRARSEKRPETELIAEMSTAHQRDFAAFDVRHDHYGSTNSAANREICHEVWAAIRRAGLVTERTVTQLYDPEAKIFLADRFVKGTCPRCSSPNQYGDSCDKCGSTYSPTDLKDPVSVFSGKRPEIRSAPHLFVQIESLHAFLEEWTQSGERLQPEIANYLKGNFLGEPLRDWDVSRPAPYFGFEIPDAPGHYWYVWFDAPIGYVATTKEWCAANGESLDAWWRSPDVEIHHFIGKDIVYFHTLFWPSMLKTAGLSLPRKVQVHGMLTVDGEKMSKSKGTFVAASTCAQHLDPQLLRYFYASKLTGKPDDFDLSPDEFAAKVNSDVVGKVVNLASRTARFVKETGLSPAYPDDGGLFARAALEGKAIAEAYEACDTSRAVRLTLALADRANEYVERLEPWKIRKQPGRERDLQDVCTIALNLFRQIVVYLAPVMPRLAEKTAALLGRPVAAWSEASVPLTGTPVAAFEPMAQRVDPAQVRAMFAASVSGDATPGS
jgi:methionyl-tRNA synthetase